MSNLIKCPRCKTWNENVEYCINCNQLLQSETQRKVELEAKQLAYKNRPKDKIDTFVAGLKNSKNPFIKGAYYIAQSIGLLFILVASVMLSFALLGPG
jgi:phage FluMu protein Com